MFSQPLRATTTSERDPSLAGRSIARPEVDVTGVDDGGLALLVLAEVPVHVRELGEGLHHRVPEQVGEGDLAAARPPQVVVDDDAVVGEQLGRHRAHAGRGRELQRRRHVLGDRIGGATKRSRRLVRPGAGARLRRLRRARRAGGGLARGAVLRLGGLRGGRRPGGLRGGRRRACRGLGRRLCWSAFSSRRGAAGASFVGAPPRPRRPAGDGDWPRRRWRRTRRGARTVRTRCSTPAGAPVVADAATVEVVAGFSSAPLSGA